MATLMTRREMRPNAEPNVIPFIDVLLVLLVIFMVTAPAPTTDIHIDAARPAGQAPADSRPTLVSILRGAGGLRYEVDGEAVAMNALAARVFERARGNNPSLHAGDVRREARIYVRADLEAPYEAVVATMDVLYGADFARVGVYAQDADAS